MILNHPDKGKWTLCTSISNPLNIIVALKWFNTYWRIYANLSLKFLQNKKIVLHRKFENGTF